MSVPEQKHDSGTAPSRSPNTASHLFVGVAEAAALGSGHAVVLSDCGCDCDCESGCSLRSAWSARTVSLGTAAAAAAAMAAAAAASSVAEDEAVDARSMRRMRKKKKVDDKERMAES